MCRALARRRLGAAVQRGDTRLAAAGGGRQAAGASSSAITFYRAPFQRLAAQIPGPAKVLESAECACSAFCAHSAAQMRA